MSFNAMFVNHLAIKQDLVFVHLIILILVYVCFVQESINQKIAPINLKKKSTSALIVKNLEQVTQQPPTLTPQIPHHARYTKNKFPQ